MTRKRKADRRRQRVRRRRCSSQESKSELQCRDPERRELGRGVARIGHGQVRLQLQHVFWKSIGATWSATQRSHGVWIGAGSAAQTEINPSRIKRFERAKLFGDYQRRMVRQHDAAGADADSRCSASEITDDDGGGGAGNARHVVMFGNPVARVSEASACCARSSDSLSASRGVSPRTTGTRSSMEMGTMINRQAAAQSAVSSRQKAVRSRYSAR